MWQDALALLIVAIAAGFWLRRFLPKRPIQIVPFRIEAAPVQKTDSRLAACPDCALAGACSKIPPPASGSSRLSLARSSA